MDLNQAISDISKKQRNLMLLIIIGLVILAGVWVAIYLDRQGPQVKEEDGQETVISEITLAGLRTPQEETKENPALRQKPSYLAGEPLALRVTTADHVKDAVQISVRLLDKGGGIHDIAPSSLEFRPGTSTFCCWRIEEAGDYQLQIFRPERTVTTVPVKIQPRPGSSKGLGN